MNSRTIVFSLFNFVISLGILHTQILAQVTIAPMKAQEEDYTWWYITLIILSVALAGTIIWWLQKKKAEKQTEKNIEAGKKDINLEGHSFDADAEMEWLRKNQGIVDRKRRKATQNTAKLNLPKTSNIFNKEINEPIEPQEIIADPVNFQDLDSLPLPVFDFQKIEPAKPFDPLPLSNDTALLSAIEQTQDEDEEDEEVRDLAVRILTAFQTRNSVEALSQVALYDLSSSLRSKAVSVLTEFDHESIFETILLACADPTREVRAAAARGLTRFSFDRANSWTRILEFSEQGRLRQAARAAIEGGFVERSFDRLIHRDPKYAYEAFVLLALTVKAGEFDHIVDALKNHHDMKVKFAILHVLKVVKNSGSLSFLYGLLEEKQLPSNLKEDVDQTIREVGFAIV